MMKIVVCGAGGHAYVVIDILQANGEHEIAGVLDANAGVSHILDVPVIGGDELIPTLAARGIGGAIVAIGSNAVRRKVYENLVRHGVQIVNAVHPSAVVSRHVRLGNGVAIMPGAVVNAGTVIGNNSIVNTGATVDHHNRIGSHVHIAPGCHLAGNVHIGDNAFLGIGTVVIDNTTVGDDVVTGGGTTLYDDVPSGSKVVGAAMRFLKTEKRTT